MPYRDGREVLLALAETLQLFRRTPQRETPIVKQWRLQKQPILHTRTPLTWTKIKVGFTDHFKLTVKKPHIPQSLRSLIEIILGRWN